MLKDRFIYLFRLIKSNFLIEVIIVICYLNNELISQKVSFFAKNGGSPITFLKWHLRDVIEAR